MQKFRLKSLNLLLAFCTIFNVLSQNIEDSQNAIIGTIKLDSTWKQKIYLSEISSFDKMFTMSNAMIISEANISQNGNFRLETSFLPKDYRFYRLHISKKNAPPASLIIGGDDENYLFFIANNKTLIKLKSIHENSQIKDITIYGNDETVAISKINKIANLIDSSGIKETYLKREFITKSINEELRFIADTSSNALVSLYALYKSGYKNNFNINKQFYGDYLNKWSHNSSQYFKDFRQSLPLNKEKKSYLNILIGIPCFLLGMLVSYYVFVVRQSNKIKKLSIQERKIFSLLQNGKSNKEISEDLNIGISTVKSHVSSIYNKLNVKSRKEIINL